MSAEQEGKATTAEELQEGVADKGVAEHPSLQVYWHLYDSKHLSSDSGSHTHTAGKHFIPDKLYFLGKQMTKH